MSDLLPPQLPNANSPSQRYLAQEFMQKQDFNPFERLINLANKLEALPPITDDEGNVIDERHVKERINLYTALCKFYAPQPKAIDINIATDNKFQIQAVDFSGLLKERAIPSAGGYDGPSLTLLTSGVDESLA